MNELYYGDNLDILRHHIADASVDLVYLDPPFNSNRNYNVLFREKSGEASPAQIQAFTDTWQWDRAAERAYDELITEGPHTVATMIAAMRQFVGSNDMMAYLVMMAQRLVELHRVLKPTGSLYLHCDPTASHYLKILLDTIFGPRNFRNEITWKRRHGFSSAVHESNRYGNVTDSIFFYAKSDAAHFTPQYNKNSPEYRAYVEKFFRLVDVDGRRYQATSLTNPAYRPNLIYEFKGYRPPANGWMISKTKMEEWDRQGRIHYPHSKDGRLRRKSYADELRGMPIQSLWDDIEQLGAHDAERLGYPTQKPLALLERIVAASSNPGDVVLDPFCGCGTAIVAAQKLDRQWIGIDITHLAIALMKNRLIDHFGSGVQFAIEGEPEDIGSARMLAEADRYQFQWWAASLVNAQPQEGKEKKGADRGIDGVIRFVDDQKGTLKRCLVQVKSGHVTSATMRDLIGTLNREKAEMAMLVSLEAPTGPMKREAVEAGAYHSDGWNRDFPRVQILTVEELLSGTKPDVPPMRRTFERAQRIRNAATHSQASLIAAGDTGWSSE